MGRLLLVGLFLGLTACHSGWDKDPFDKEQDNIKNAIKPDQEIPKTPPPEQTTLFVKMEQVYSVVEGDTLEIPVDYEIAHPDVKLTSIQVQGLEEKFPGSVFDTQKNIIRITPPFDFVPVDTPYIVQPLSVSFFNEYAGQVQEVKRTVVIHVIPQNETVPVIEKAEFPTGQVVTAGVEKDMVIEVYDTSKEFSPRISVVNAFGTSLQGAQFVKIPAEGVYNPTDDVWEFTAKVNVPKDYYLPNGFSRVTVDVFAYSITGIPSRSKAVGFSIDSDNAVAPKIVTENKIYFTEKQENQYTFSAFDIRGSGDVTAKCDQMPTDLICDCRRDAFNGGVHFCTVSWFPQTAGEFKLIFLARNRVLSSVATTQREVTIEVGSAK